MSTPKPMVLPSQEALARLASEDPQAFETLRHDLVENCILRAPERLQLRLRQLQFRIDGIRRRAGSPLGALIKIQNLMWESFLRMDSELQRYARSTTAMASNDPAPLQRPRAQVIDFQSRLLARRGAAPI